MKVVFIGNSGFCISKQRTEIVKTFIEKGHEVIVFSPMDKYVQGLVDLGCKYYETKMQPKGTNPIKDLQVLRNYKKLLKMIKPDMVFTFTIKPNIYGAWACKDLKIPCVANITGLGTAVENGGLIQKITVMLYKIAFKKIKTVFFQNTENMQFFIDRKIALNTHKLIPGSGVNLDIFTYEEYVDTGVLNFYFVARIMKEKGIDNFLETAKYIKEKYPSVTFTVCGSCDSDYAGILKEYEDNGIILYKGMVDSVHEAYKDAHCLIHPTYYPEGLCNSLIESLATGRPIITTNRSGCREVVEDGVNGFIVEQQNTSDLIEKVEKFIALPFEEKKQLGINGRQKIEREFDRQIVINAYLEELSI